MTKKLGISVFLLLFSFIQLAPLSGAINAQSVDTANLIAQGTPEEAEEILDAADNPRPDASCETAIAYIGWILCPVAEFFLDALESIVRDGLVASILNFDALDGESNQQDALRSIWSGFLAIANIGFVIAFLVVVYSATTGGVLSAYDVKRLAPKLLAGAIMVQLSFFISTQLVYLFNAFGESIVDIMLSPLGGEGGAGTGSLFNTELISFEQLYAPLSEFISALILLLIIVASIFSIVGVFLIIIVFLLRNMALMVLTVISPLAFVAWILPNTENLFKKWWSLYIQLLAIFPIAMAFLASGRLVSSVWAAGDGFANQWIGLIALFLPYIVAPKLFSFAGSAITGIVRTVNNAADTAKKRGAQARKSSVGRRAETGAKSRAATAVNKRWGAGADRMKGDPGKFDRAMGRAAQTKFAQRASADAQQAQKAIMDEDMKAATSNIDANRAQARRGYGVGADGNPLRGDDAEAAYLASLLREDSRATEAEQEAAVRTLLNVHSSRTDAVQSVSDFIQRLDATSKDKGKFETYNGEERGIERVSGQQQAAAGALRGRIIYENKGSLGSIPQLAKPNKLKTVQGMDARDLHGLKAGSVGTLAGDSSAALEIARRSSKAVREGGVEAQMVREGNIGRLLEATQNEMEVARQRGDQASVDQYLQTINEISTAFEIEGGKVVGRKQTPPTQPQQPQQPQ